MREYFIDLGSSTTKVYEYSDGLKLLEERSIYFKNVFDSIRGISETNLEELCNYFKELKNKYDFKYENTHIYVTGIFRELCHEKS